MTPTVASMAPRANNNSRICGVALWILRQLSCATGRIDWIKHIDRLFASFLGHFQLPVGTATADMKPGSMYPSHRASMLFRNSGTSAIQDIPKCIIYLLRNKSSQGKRRQYRGGAKVKHSSLNCWLESFCGVWAIFHYLHLRPS